MNTERLQTLLSCFPHHRILVFGDFFLDQYLEIDPKLNEVSIETGKIAYQIVGKRLQPGAAGTVCNNLTALGIGGITALSVIGDDGEGYELRKALAARRVAGGQMIVSPQRFTPTYTKPMVQLPDREEELERQDIKNRRPLPEAVETELLQRLETMIAAADAVIIADQVQERNCGVVTDRARARIAELAQENPKILFFADSRERIGEFKNVYTKPNRSEATRSVQQYYPGEIPTYLAVSCAQTLRQRTGKSVFLTLDQEGICPVTEHETPIIPCPPVTGLIDIVGAGDSVTAGIVSSLASGACEAEAAIIGNLVASITIRQLGTTGAATPQQVLEAWNANEALYREIA